MCQMPDLPTSLNKRRLSHSAQNLGNWATKKKIQKIRDARRNYEQERKRERASGREDAPGKKKSHPRFMGSLKEISRAGK